MSSSADDAVRASFDLPADGTLVSRGAVRVAGWAFAEAGPIQSAMLVVDDGVATPVRLGILREDVGIAFPDVPHACASGFVGTVDLRTDVDGKARIALLVRTGDGGWQEAAAVELGTTAPASALEGARRRAAFTIVQDEASRLPLWLGYYGRYFAPDDLYVIDHDSADGTTAGLDGRCQVVPVHRQASFDHRWLRDVVEAFQAFLLHSYDTVLFAEVDEFIVADPRLHSGLDAYVDGLTRPAVRCAGFNVVHQPDEPPLRFDVPLLAQRRYWHASLQYSKRLVSRVPLRWSEGFHDEYNAPDDPPDPALLLVHLHRVDYDACLARHSSAAARAWSDEDFMRGAGDQNRITKPAEFEQWFRNGPDLDAPRERIPAHIRALL